MDDFEARREVIELVSELLSELELESDISGIRLAARDVRMALEEEKKVVTMPLRVVDR